MTSRLSPRAWLALAGVYLAVVAAYYPALRGGLLWDDDAHVTRPELQSAEGLRRIWFEVGATQQYYPVLHSAFWVEHRLWGDATLGYHLANVFWHATAACLLILLLRRLAVPGAWLAGVVFALHPMGVESVAWISEQKNTLSTVFYLLAALAYLRFDETRRPGTYALAALWFVLALLTKSVTATLPAALLVVLWWRRGRLSWARDAVPLLPWLGAGAAAGLCTAWVERRFIGAQGAAFDLSFAGRCLIAGRAAWFYLGKLLWPAHLTFIYPRWEVGAGSPGLGLFSLAVLVVLAVLWRRRRGHRGPLAAALLFLGSLFPALGFFNVYPFVNSFVADHFAYLASLGVIAALAAVLAGLRFARPLAVLLVCLLGILTWRQSRMYRSAEVLYRETIARNPGAWLAHNNLGILLRGSGRAAEALAHYDEAIRLKPDYADAHCNRGIVLGDQHRWPEAIAEYDRALALRPGFLEAHYDLGRALDAQGRVPEALAQFEAAALLGPDRAEVQNNLGNALAQLGRPAEAETHYRAAMRLQPGYAEAHYDLGILLRASGRLPEAIAQYREALRLRPLDPNAHFYLGLALAASGRWDEAIAAYGEALRLRPNDAAVHFNLAQALEAAGRPAEARVHFQRAVHLTTAPPDSAIFRPE